MRTGVGTVRKLKLKGVPWSNKGEKGADGQATLINVIGRLGNANWRLLTATNLKGFLASLLFVRDSEYLVKSADLAMLSPHGSDRIRLVNFDQDDRLAIRSAIAEISCQVGSRKN